MLAELWGDIASVLGVAIGIGGFTFTILQVRKSRTAAEAARSAARATSRQLRRIDTLADVTRAYEYARRIMELHRASSWEPAVERCHDLKALLVRTHTLNLGIPPEYAQKLQYAITHVSSLAAALEKQIGNRTATPNVDRWNKLLGQIADDLQRLTMILRQKEPDRDNTSQ
jgi:hypothetical protein